MQRQHCIAQHGYAAAAAVVAGVAVFENVNALQAKLASGVTRRPDRTDRHRVVEKQQRLRRARGAARADRRLAGPETVPYQPDAGEQQCEVNQLRQCNARPRSLWDLISRMRCGQKARLQGARSAVWSFQISDEQRSRRAFWPQPAGRASPWAQGGVATALIVARTTARSCALPCTQSEARAYVKSSPTGSWANS